MFCFDLSDCCTLRHFAVFFWIPDTLLLLQVPIYSVRLDSVGRLIIELYPTVTTIDRPWSAVANTIYDPMQPIQVSYNKQHVPRNLTNSTHPHRKRIEEIEQTEQHHISDGFNRAVSSFYKLKVFNQVYDHTSPIYQQAFVFDSTPNVIRIQVEELDVFKICAATCGRATSTDFVVRIQNVKIPSINVVASIHEGEIHLLLLKDFNAITYQQKVHLSYTPSANHPEQRLKDVSGVLLCVYCVLTE